MSSEKDQTTPPPPEDATLREILQLLVRTKKSLRLYQVENPVTDKLVGDLFARFAGVLEETGDVTLEINDSQILHDKAPVYENQDRKESLAFLFFRDGIRSLTFLPSLERDELHSFLSCLNRVGLLSGNDDDLVTLFWENDYQGIRYQAVEELADEAVGTQVLDQLSSGALDPTQSAVEQESGEGGTGTGVRGVGLDDLKRPDSLPVEEARLSESEVDRLRAELAAEEENDPLSMVPVVAAELTALDTSEEGRHEIAATVVAVLEQPLSSGAFLDVARQVERLVELAETTFSDVEAVGDLVGTVCSELAGPKRFALLLESLESRSDLEPVEERLLFRLAPSGLPTLFTRLERIESPDVRRALSRAAIEVRESCLSELQRVLSSTRKAPGPRLVSEVLFLLRHLPEKGSVQIVERLLATASTDARRDATVALGHFRGGRVERLWLNLLDDDDARIRGRAITALARTGNRALAQEVLARTVSQTTQRSLEETMLATAAVSKLAGDEAVGWLSELLQPAKRRWFLPRRKRELAQAAAHAIAVQETELARTRLRELAASGDRFCRAACRKALETRSAAKQEAG